MAWWDLASPPQWIEPELCKLVTRIPAGDNWAHEIKFDASECMLGLSVELPRC
jgi:hypothetical protein